MMRRTFKPTPVAVALQAASLLAVAVGVFGILISDMTRHRGEVARAEASSKMQLLALPDEKRAKPR